MISIYTADEQERLSASGRLLGRAFEKVSGHVKAGVSTLELDEIVYDFIDAEGGEPSFLGYRGFPASICASINEVILHGIPDKKIFKEGDLITLDIGVRYKGLCTDRAVTYAVGKVSDEAARLKNCAEEALAKAIALARPGGRIGDLSNAMFETAKAASFDVIREYSGHGVGHEVHEEPSIDNYGKQERGVEIRAGMCLAIESMFCAGKGAIRLGKDGWAVSMKDGRLSAHSEHTLIVTEEGPKVITA